MSAETAGPRDVRIPDHELIRAIGQGSYGEVWLARTLFGKFRAVKIVFRQRFRQDRPFDRELEGIQKFEPISRSHPGLVTILHVGEQRDRGYFYYVMEVADDASSGLAIDPAVYVPHTLASELAGGRALTPLAVVRLGLELCASLDCLHTAGLIHRDVKPSNIIYTGGRPKLADIGLVTEISDSATFVGTEGYIPPEGPGSPRADVFSLGKVLYEAATGLDRTRFPEWPTSLPEDTDWPLFRRLNEVILKACDRDLEQRYSSAHAFAEDLQLLVRDSAATVTGGEGARESTLVLWSARVPRHQARAAGCAEALRQSGGRAEFSVAGELSVDWARKLEAQMKSIARVVVLVEEGALRDPKFVYALELVAQRQRTAGADLRVFWAGSIRPDELFLDLRCEELSALGTEVEKRLMQKAPDP